MRPPTPNQPATPSRGLPKPLIIGVAFVVLVAAIWIVFKPLGGQPAGNAGPPVSDTNKTTPAKEADDQDAGPRRPGRWHQNYQATFLYGGQTVAARRVDVTGLNRKWATAKLTTLVLPARTPNRKWILDKRRWTVSVDGRWQTARKVTQRVVGNKHHATATFRWPSKLMRKGSKISVQIPDSHTGRPHVVSFGLEVPPSHQGIREVNGAGGI